MVLTEQEKALAANAAVLLTKNRIIQAVYDLFGQLAEAFKETAANLPADVLKLHPKISRGENYQGLPWVMLDYPRFFAGGESFAIRTMFWWGNHFSLHLLLQGSKMQLLTDPCIEPGWFLSTAADPWQHHFEENRCIPAEELTKAVLTQQAAAGGFLKMSCYLPVTGWDEAAGFLQEKFGEAVRMIQHRATA